MSARHTIGSAILKIARVCYHKAFGLRLPAARIRLANIQADKAFIAARLEESFSDAAYWSTEMERANRALRLAEAAHRELHRRAELTDKSKFFPGHRIP